MTAGVHRTVPRRELQSGLLADRQRVHVGPQQHRGTGVLSAEDGGHGTESRARADLKLERLECVDDRRLGARQFEAHLGFAMQTASKCDEAFGESGGVLAQRLRRRHGHRSAHRSATIGAPFSTR
ncbi:hypothetical protein AB0M95_15950 [Sphaerisporangium sp. NPDC051017]|uniref:hypothetical protein n=1 Tax=Sphaerisporangium sp. NPDC051017 TaxID=3154636 RepID=UPI003435295C